jgi:hypothetical protein
MVEMPNDKLSAVRKSVRVEGMGTKMWTQDADGKPTLLGDVFSLFREIGAAVDRGAPNEAGSSVGVSTAAPISRNNEKTSPKRVGLPTQNLFVP